MNHSDSGFLAGESLLLSTKFRDIELISTSTAGHSCVYRAQRMGKWHALKCLKPEYAGQKEYLALMQKEFEIGYQLNHPNIVRTIGLEEVDGLGICIIMEYVDGQTLKDVIAKSSLTQDQCLHILIQLCEALTYIHQRQIIHRDLKPENIMLTANSQYVKLIDFGLSDAEDYAILKAPAGTRRYAAPEVGFCPDIDLRADIYSLGIIMQELPCNKFKVKRIAKRCTLPDRENRYQSAEAVAAALQKRQRLPWLIIAIVMLLSMMVFYTILPNQQKETITMPFDKPSASTSSEKSLDHIQEEQTETIKVIRQQTKQSMAADKASYEEAAILMEKETTEDPQLLQLCDYTANLIQKHIIKGEDVSNEILEKIDKKAEQLAGGNAVKFMQWRMEMQALVNTMTATYHDSLFKSRAQQISDTPIDKQLLTELTAFGRTTAKQEIDKHFPHDPNGAYPIIQQLIDKEVTRRVGSASPLYNIYITAATNAAYAYSREFYAQPETLQRLRAYADSDSQQQIGHPLE